MFRNAMSPNCDCRCTGRDFIHLIVLPCGGFTNPDGFLSGCTVTALDPNGNPTPVFTETFQGQYSLDVTSLPKGVYTITVTPPAGSHYDPVTITVTVGIGITDCQAAPRATSGYSCFQSFCCNNGVPDYPAGSHGPYFQYTYPSQFTWTDPIGSTILPQTGPHVWSALATRGPVGAITNCLTGDSGIVDVNVLITLTCLGGGLWQGAISAYCCAPIGFCSGFVPYKDGVPGFGLCGVMSWFGEMDCSSGSWSTGGTYFNPLGGHGGPSGCVENIFGGPGPFNFLVVGGP